MITYRYEEYRPEDDNPWTTDKLMSILSELVMRHDIQLEQALRMLIDRGLPANVFLKRGGMQDLVERFLDQLQEQVQGVLDKHEIDSAIQQTLTDMRAHRAQAEKKTKSDPGMKQRLGEAVDAASVDALYRMKWDAKARDKSGQLSGDLDLLIRDIEDHNTISAGAKKYEFRGKTPLNRSEALLVIEQLEEMGKLMSALEQSIKNGDLFNFNLEKLARYLGQESYQEFLERREQIFEQLRGLLEKKGAVVRDEETGEYKLSPASVRRIGRRALEEIFSAMKTDTSGGSHKADEAGESENVGSTTRPLEFGDSLANMDISSSIVNAIIRTGSPRPSFRDIEIFEARGSAKAATVVLLDMSGSMLRADRFYNAKRMVLALDALIREGYRDDRLMIAGFGTLAERFSPADIPTLQPFPITIYDPHIRLRIDMAKATEKSKERIPRYFTNLQRGLQLARMLLGTSETRNKQIILVTDGVPTAHFEESILHINYPPSPGDFESSLREVRCCTDEGIVINTFLLTSDWEMSYFGEESFIQQFAKQSMGRIFYPHPGELDKMILVDFIANKKKQFSISAAEEAAAS